MSGLLTVSDLRKAYAGVHALDGVSFEVAAGSITGLIGPNGSGKSTAIDCLSGFQKLDGGRVSLDGTDITGRPAHLIALRDVPGSPITKTQNICATIELRSTSAHLIGLTSHFCFSFVLLLCSDRTFA